MHQVSTDFPTKKSFMSCEPWCDITTDRIWVSVHVNIFIQEKKKHKLSEFHGKLREISEDMQNIYIFPDDKLPYSLDDYILHVN